MHFFLRAEHMDINGKSQQTQAIQKAENWLHGLDDNLILSISS